jgi:aa3 type cytochrome c oxidase subunit IV
MADIHGAATADDDMDLPAHEATYAEFLALVQLVIVVLLCHLLLLVLWGLEGHPFVALIGFILTLAAAAIGGLTGLGWKSVAPIFVLLGLACIVL